MSVEARAFVLRKVNYRESDLIVTLLVEGYGKVGAIARRARASKKRFGGSLLPMRVIEASLQFKPQRDLAVLQEAQVVQDFREIETSYDRITVASYATELVRAMTRDEDRVDDVFELLRRFYDSIGTCDESLDVLESVLHHFELALLEASGGAPSIDRCHRCGVGVETMDKYRCTRGGEGLVCQSCVEDRERYGILEAPTLAVLEYLRNPGGDAPPGIADPTVRGQVRRVIDASLARFIDSELKSRGMLDSVFFQPDASGGRP